MLEQARAVRVVVEEAKGRVPVVAGAGSNSTANTIEAMARVREVGADAALVVVDAGMNDLLRPALYGAEHAIVPVRAPRGRAQTVDLVGPVCESTDVLARARRLVLPEPGVLLAIRGAGAYGMSMASTYNGRPRPAEVLVSGRRARVIRRRDRVEDLWRGEAAGR